MSKTECVTFADRACQETVVVTENVQLARDTWRVRFECPTLMPRAREVERKAQDACENRRPQPDFQCIADAA